MLTKPRFNGKPILVFILGLAFAGTCLYGWFAHQQTPPQPTNWKQVDEITDEIFSLIQNDLAIAGSHVYDFYGEKLVLLTYGETLGLSMEVMPEINGDAVYFNVSAAKVSGSTPAYEYKVYTTNAETVSANETHLKNPAYGPGTTGVNIGFLLSGNGEDVYAIPLLDTKAPDHVFYTEQGTKPEDGLYQYEYKVTAFGAAITSVKRVEWYQTEVFVTGYDEESQTAKVIVAPDGVGFTLSTATVDEYSAYWLAQYKEMPDVSETVVVYYGENGPAILMVGAMDTFFTGATEEDTTDELAEEDSGAVEGELPDPANTR